MSTNVEGQSVSPNDAKPLVSGSLLDRAENVAIELEKQYNDCHFWKRGNVYADGFRNGANFVIAMSNVSNPLLFSKAEEDLLVANNFYYVGHAMGKSWGSWEINKNGKRIYFRFNNDKIGSSKKVLSVVSKDGFNETEINTITSEMLLSLQ